MARARVHRGAGFKFHPPLAPATWQVEGPAVVVACQWTYTVMTQRRSRLKLGFSSCPSTEARCWLPVPLTGGSSGDAGPIMSRPSEPAPQVAKAI